MPISIFSKFMIFCINMLKQIPYLYSTQNCPLTPPPPPKSPYISISSFNIIIIPICIISKCLLFYVNVLIYTPYLYMFSKLTIDPSPPQKKFPPPPKTIHFYSKHSLSLASSNYIQRPPQRRTRGLRTLKFLQHNRTVYISSQPRANARARS